MFRRLEIFFLLLCIPFLASCAATGAIVTTAAFGVVAYEEARLQRPDLKLQPAAERLQWPEKWRNADFVGDGVAVASSSVDRVKNSRAVAYVGEKMPDMDWWPDMLTFDLKWPSVPDVQLSSNWPYMHFSSNQTATNSPKNKASNVSPKEANSSSSKETKTSSTSPTFGFNCSNLETKQKQSECFNQFSKSLANQGAKATGPKPGFSSKGFMKGKEASKTQKVARTFKKLSKKIANRLPSKIANQYPSKKVNRLPSKTANRMPSTASGDSSFPPTSFVKNWATAWEKQDVDYYLSFYSEKFKGKKKHRSSWEASRHRALKKNKNISINLSDIRIQKRGINGMEISFVQEYKSDEHTDTGEKELILEKDGPSWKIIKETWMPGGKKSASREKQINVKLAGWLKAWENQDVNSYLAFYSNKFGGPKGNRAEWKNARGYALKNSNNLAIEISNLKVDRKSDTIELNFIQKFSSDKHFDVGIKELVWVNTGSDWKILKEYWIPS